MESFVQEHNVGFQGDFRYASSAMGRSSSEGSDQTSHTASTYWFESSTDDHTQTDAKLLEHFDGDGAGFWDFSPGSLARCQYAAQQESTSPVLRSTPYQLFDQTIGAAEILLGSLARQATEYALGLLANGDAYGRPVVSLITHEAVEEEIQKTGQSSEREAIQQLLSQHLRQHFESGVQPPTNVIVMLREAAYQILRLRNEPEAYSLCYLTLMVVLTELRDLLLSDELSRMQSFRASQIPARPTQGGKGRRHGAADKARRADKEKFACQSPNCKNKVFGRSADLERHCKVAHPGARQRKTFVCDYRKCDRHEKPFFRQDHFRDHLREFHKEDLPRRGLKTDQHWWATRHPKALFNGWWRCNRCLTTRVNHDLHGYVCSSCGNHCEVDRQKFRLSLRDKRKM